MASVDAISQFDIPRLSSFLSIPHECLDHLVAVAGEHAVTILSSINAKAVEYDELRADKMRAEVELEQEVRTSVVKVKGVKGQLDAALKENQLMRERLSTAENDRTSLETQLSSTKTTRTNMDDQTRTLRARIQTLESEKRETLEAFERKNSDYDRLQEEYQAVQSKVIGMRTDIGKLETEFQQAQSIQTTAKFREQSLLQEIELLKKNNEWFESELKTKTADFQKFRKEKAAQVSTLQRELEDALSSAEMTKRSTETLRQRYGDVSRKAEEALQRIKDLQEKLVTQEEAFRAEMSSQQRLAQLWEESAKGARARVAQLEQLLEQEREKECAEIGQAHAEAETERVEKEAAEAKVAELEVQVERLEEDLAAYRNGLILPPSTPMKPTNGASTPQRPGSSLGIFSNSTIKLQKSGISMTQLYSDYTAAKTELERERRRNDKLQGHFDDLIHEFELKGPEIQEMRSEHERMQGEIVEMSLLLEDMSRERDKAKKSVQKFEMRVSNYERESGALKQQLRDLSLQVQFLLSEVDYLSSGNEQLSTADRIRFQQFAGGELRHNPSLDETPTDRIITERLLRFKNIQELQAQNENLLKVTRELAAKLEDDERKTQEEMEGRQTEEVVQLKKALDRYRDELKAMNTKSQSYVRERDMFRRMLQNRGDIAKGDNDPTGSPAPSEPASLINNQSLQDYANLLKELQSHFDQYKHEAATDHNTLKEQSQKLAQEKSELQVQVAKANSQLELAAQRLEMLNDNFKMLQSENQELQKRISSMHEISARQDLRSQQVAEELVDSRSILESMRNENANLKAEKELWKKIEERLAGDNESLTLERTRLNSHINSLQALQAERDRAEEESRRRLQNQVDKLEQELVTTRRKLHEEADEARRATAKKEYELHEMHKRVDDLTQTLGKAREEFVEARTQRDTLQTRVNDLQVELKTTEEKLAILHPRALGNAEDVAMAEKEDEEEEQGEGLSKEQELQIQVADITKELEHTKRELHNVREEVEQYKRISQTAEEELENMNNTHDQFKESMDAEIRERDATIKDLEQRVEDISSELTDSANELEKIRRTDLEVKRRFIDEKSILESEISRLKDEAEKVNTATSFYQDDLRAQARIAQEAQQNYERELVKHAEAAQQLQKVRAEFSELKTEIHRLRGDTETAKESLVVNEESWNTQKENYEKELGEIRSRCEDLKKQNKSLLEQLDNVGMQIGELQKSRAAGEDGMEVQEGDDAISDDALEKLRRTFTWLRREKEIVDVQLELNLQETKRLKQQLTHSQNTLDETRLLLAQERERNSSRLQGEEQHKSLMEKINELNLLRESNIALRSDGERKAKRVQELQVQLEELTAKIQPLEEQVRHLEVEREVNDSQMKLLREDNDRWKSRTQQILQKYDRVDPEALEALKDQVITLQEKLAIATVERAQAHAELQERLASHAKELENVVQSWKAKLDRLVQDTKERLKNLRTQLNEKIAEIEALKQQVDQQRTELEKGVAERDVIRQQTESQININSGASVALQQISDDKRKLEDDINTLTLAKNGLQEKLQQVEHELANTRRTALEQFRDLSIARQRIKELEPQTQELGSTVTSNTDITKEQPMSSTTDALSEAQTSDIESIVAARVQEEREKLANEKANLEKRLSDARAKFGEFQRKAIEAEKEKHEKILSEKEQELQAEINKILEEQVAKIEEVKSQVKQEYESRIAELEAQVKEMQEELRAEREKAATIPTTPTVSSGTPTSALPPSEELKKIVKRNVDHRLAKEREKWEKDVETTREAMVQARLAEEVEKSIKQRTEEWTLKETELIQKNSRALESAKESAKQEAMMRSKVQVSMLEKKNKLLEEKVQALEAVAPSSAVAGSPVTASVPRPSFSLPVPVGPQHQSQQQQPQHVQQQGRPETPTNLPQPISSGLPTPIPHAISQDSNNITETTKGQGETPRPGNILHLGTTPALRSLRGALAPTTLRGGAQVASGRGTGQIPQPAQSRQQPQLRTLGMPPHIQGSQQQTQFQGGLQQQQGPPQQMRLSQQVSQAAHLAAQQAHIHPHLTPPHQYQLGAPARGGSQLPRGGGSMRGGLRPGRGQGGQSGLVQPGQIQSSAPTPGGPQQQLQQSPGGADKLNAQAKQFMPGKRQREEGEIDESGQDGGNGGHPQQGGKRIRGGGPGGAATPPQG